MRKHQMALHVTLHSDSQTAEYYVEHDAGGGIWELWSEGTLTPSSGLSAACVELQELLSATMAEASPSMSHTSDLG